MTLVLAGVFHPVEPAASEGNVNWKQLTVLLFAALLLAVILSADTVNYKYDDAGRLTGVSYADGTVIAYTYDNAGNMLARTVTAPVQQTTSQTKSASKTRLADRNPRNSKPSK
jgi:YD repeat-containing protein